MPHIPPQYEIVVDPTGRSNNDDEEESKTVTPACFCSPLVGYVRTVLSLGLGVHHGKGRGGAIFHGIPRHRGTAEHHGNNGIGLGKEIQRSISLATTECGSESGLSLSSASDVTTSSVQQETQTSSQTQEHPELEDLYLIDLLSGERIRANSQPTPIENEMFKGHLLFLSRTSDADSKEHKQQPNHNHSSSSDGTPLNNVRSNYLRHKQRRFEIQVQCKFKKVPPSQLYFHCQLKEPVQMGTIQKAFVGATLRFIKRKNKGAFIYNVPGKEPTPKELRKGRYEKPHLTFVVEKIFHRIARTRPGEKLPTLGTEIYEDPVLVKKRVKGEPFEFNTTDTFTFALWSAYIDFTQWKWYVLFYGFQHRSILVVHGKFLCYAATVHNDLPVFH